MAKYVVYTKHRLQYYIVSSWTYNSGSVKTWSFEKFYKTNLSEKTMKLGMFKFIKFAVYKLLGSLYTLHGYLIYMVIYTLFINNCFVMFASHFKLFTVITFFPVSYNFYFLFCIKFVSGNVKRKIEQMRCHNLTIVVSGSLILHEHAALPHQTGLDGP